MGSIRSHDYREIGAAGLELRPRRHAIPQVPATPGLVVEDAETGYCGEVIIVHPEGAVLEDRHGRRRIFPLRPAGFLLDGVLTTLVRPEPVEADRPPVRSASGSVRLDGLRARTARAGRIWVEGLHDAELVERVWGHDLRIEGVVVEPLHGIDDLPDLVADFEPGPSCRLGILVDHLVTGSKESRLADAVAGEHVMVVGHPFVDVWEAVRPAALGIPEWPRIPRGVPWKDGICAALGWGDPTDGARRVLGAVRSYRDLETPLVGAVERLIDFVTAGA